MIKTLIFGLNKAKYYQTWVQIELQQCQIWVLRNDWWHDYPIHCEYITITDIEFAVCDDMSEKKIEAKIWIKTGLKQKNVRNAPRGMGVLVGEKILNIVQGMVRYALGYFLMNYIAWPSYYSLLL